MVGAPVRADRALVEMTESDETVLEALAAVDSQEAAGPQTLLGELAQEVQGQDPPEPPGS